VVQALDTILGKVRIKPSPSHQMIYKQRVAMRRRMNAIHLLWSETVSCDKVAASTSLYYAKWGELALLETQSGCIYLRIYPVIHYASS